MSYLLNYPLLLFFYVYRRQQYSGGAILIKNLHRSAGGGSIHITRRIVFQEFVGDAQCLKEIVSIPRPKRRFLILPTEPDSSPLNKINPKKKKCYFS